MAATSFSGRVLTSASDPSATDISGPHTVMYPASAVDVAVALGLTKRAHRDLYVRSGTHAVSRAVVHGTGAVVLNLRRLCGVEADAGSGFVTVGPSATVGELADALTAAGLFLPLSDTSVKSVVADVLSTEPGFMTRSAGPLRDYLRRLHYARADGTVAVAEADGDDDAVDALLAGDAVAVVTCLQFRALRAHEAAHLWLAHFALPYAAPAFRRLVRRAFARPRSLASDVDLVVRAATDQYNLPVVTVTAAGAGDAASRAAALAVLSELVSDDADPDAPVAQATFEGTAIVDAVAEMGDMGGVSLGLHSSRHLRTVEEGDVPRFAGRLARVVDHALGHSADRLVHFTHVAMNARLCRGNSDRLHARVIFFAPREMDPREVWLFRLLNSVVPLVPPRTKPFKFAPEPASVAAMGLPDAFALPPPPPAAEDPKMMAAEAAAVEVIPGFRGQVFTPEDGELYTMKAHTYASSSYPEKDMTPAIVAFPEDVADLAAAVQHATTEGMRVVPRSGGHQYSGLSSGGEDALVLSMDRFAGVSVAGNKATIGVGTRLTDIAAAFKEHGVTIPHGECPYVAIGGHVQSGGYGHLLRSFGLALDYVYSFNIVVGDGSLKTVTRPADASEQGLFWAVLGGGPGSFGILTEITFEAILDREHPYSHGHVTVRFWEKDVFRVMMDVVREWTQDLDGEIGDLLQDVDLMCTATSSRIPLLPPIGYYRGILLLEMVHGNKAGAQGKEASEKAEKLFVEVHRRVQEEKGFLNWHQVMFQGRTPLSHISDNFVRRNGTTSDGREFKYPYDKRLNGTYYPLSAGFVETFVDLVEETITDRDVRLVFQMGLGGGSHRHNARRSLTACSRRDIAFLVVYDVFYKPGYESKAQKLQERMRKLLHEEFPDKDSVRLMWGSYGDTDIRNVRDNYYDSPELYKQLQMVKDEVDPANVFRTRLTVQPTRVVETGSTNASDSRSRKRQRAFE